MKRKVQEYFERNSFRVIKFVRQSINPFMSHPLRTLLALLGIVFGVAAVVSMISIGEGAQEEIMNAIKALGADIVHIKANPIAEEHLGKSVNTTRGLSRYDVESIALHMQDIRASHIAYTKQIKVYASDASADPKSLLVYGANKNFIEVMGQKISQGRNFFLSDFKQNMNVAIVGNEIAKRLSKNDPKKALGNFIRLNQSYWEIIGILESKEEGLKNKETQSLPLLPFEFEKMILLPYEVAFAKIEPPKVYSELDYVAIKVESIEKTEGYRNLINSILKKTHHESEDYTTVAPLELLHQKQKTQRIFNVVLLSIAALSLLVGGIGIMNIMLANVLERVKEIGIRRAIGATKKNILHQFLAESIAICLLGGILGILLGMLISFGVTLFADIPAVLSFKAMGLSFGISLFVGVLFGILPARQAANVNPIKALHSE